MQENARNARKKAFYYLHSFRCIDTGSEIICIDLFSDMTNPNLLLWNHEMIQKSYERMRGFLYVRPPIIRLGKCSLILIILCNYQRHLIINRFFCHSYCRILGIFCHIFWDVCWAFLIVWYRIIGSRKKMVFINKNAIQLYETVL